MLQIQIIAMIITFILSKEKPVTQPKGKHAFPDRNFQKSPQCPEGDSPSYSVLLIHASPSTSHSALNVVGNDTLVEPTVPRSFLPSDRHRISISGLLSKWYTRGSLF